MYVGGLENWPDLIEEMGRLRPLWGNSAESLRQARSPSHIAVLLENAGLPHPPIQTRSTELPHQGTWLVKPLAGAGGAGIRFWFDRKRRSPRARPVYYQEYVEGDPCSAVYVGDGQRATLLGVTRQLIGESWLHAPPFRYCGSVGPLLLSDITQSAFVRLGTVLSAECGLLGLFGVDCVLREGVPWPVEINPRYTASVEVLELTRGIPALALHRQVFEPSTQQPPARAPNRERMIVGKAILFAGAAFDFPDDGPWMSVLRMPNVPWGMPAFADIPEAGEQIKAGKPILTFFSRASSAGACLDNLRQTAMDLDRWLEAH
jgi:predicted ATP-grasp superfamily ATP-dependent carboligase